LYFNQVNLYVIWSLINIKYNLKIKVVDVCIIGVNVWECLWYFSGMWGGLQ